MKITDEMLYRHAAEARDIWLDTLPNDSEIPEHEFSDGFNKEMDRLVALPPKKKKPTKRFRRVAAMFAAVLIGASSWLAVDAEARATFMQWVRTIAPDYVVYHFIGEAPEEDIPNFYCTWLPEGMEAKELHNGGQTGDLFYEADDDWVYCLSYHYMHDGAAHALSASSDEMFHETVEVNGMPGDYYYEDLEEGHFGDLLWFDEESGIAFSIHGMIPKEDMIRMAESVQEGTPLEYMPEYEYTWLPDGYRDGDELFKGSHARLLSSITKDNDSIRLEYEIMQADTLAEHFYIDEYTAVKEVAVWGEPAELYYDTQRDGSESLLWYDAETNIAFHLESTESEETILKIAEAIKQK